MTDQSQNNQSQNNQPQNNQQRRRPQQNNRNRNRGRGGGNQPQQQQRKPGDLWRAVPPLPDVEPIVPATDATAMLRSLGDPPLQGQGQVAEHYLAAVVDRAANLARALALAGGLLARPADD